MSVKRLSISGLRGFAEKVDFEFAIPDKEHYGSGLTVLLGPNNSGKSTILEAFHLLTINSDTLPKNTRNETTGKIVKIEAEDCNGDTFSLETTKQGGSYIERKRNEQIEENFDNKLRVFILNNKRSFNSTFNNNMYQTRDNYIGNVGNNEYRSENNINNNFGSRLIDIFRNKRDMFDACLKKILDPVPKWTVESLNNNSSYLEFTFGNASHNSQGAGDGYINIFNIIDALYDSDEDNIILIDEPEVSLHPDLQRKLFEVLIEYSKDKQIIISTHSPYFVDWELFIKYSKVIRLKKVNNIIKNYELSNNTKDEIKTILNDPCHPHVLSLNANEIFFLNDNIILTEGQEDVVCYKKIFKNYDVKVNASFFGWGAGGADKIEKILNMLKDLGYEKVFIILDNNKKDLIKNLKIEFPGYQYYAIQADDIRAKEDNKIDNIIKGIEEIYFDEETKHHILTLVKQNSGKVITGLVKDRQTCEINEQYKEDVQKLINAMKDYFENSKDNNNQENEKEDNNSQQLTVNQIKNTDNNELESAEKLLNEHLENYDLQGYLEKKYKYFKFIGDMGDIISLKKIKSQKYYALVEREASISKNHSVLMIFKLVVNTKIKRVKIARKIVISNTLPISRIQRAIEKIIN